MALLFLISQTGQSPQHFALSYLTVPSSDEQWLLFALQCDSSDEGQQAPVVAESPGRGSRDR